MTRPVRKSSLLGRKPRQPRFSGQVARQASWILRGAAKQSVIGVKGKKVAMVDFRTMVQQERRRGSGEKPIRKRLGSAVYIVLGKYGITKAPYRKAIHRLMQSMANAVMKNDNEALLHYSARLRKKFSELGFSKDQARKFMADVTATASELQYHTSKRLISNIKI